MFVTRRDCFRFVTFLGAAIGAFEAQNTWVYVIWAVGLNIAEFATDGFQFKKADGEGNPYHHIQATVCLIVSLFLWNNRKHPNYELFTPVSDSLLALFFWKAIELFRSGIPPTRSRTRLSLSLALAFLTGMLLCTMLSADVCPALMKPYQKASPVFWVQLINVTDDPTQRSKAVAFQVGAEMRETF